MKAKQKQVFVDRETINKMIKSEVAKAYPQIQEEIEIDITKQVLAMVLYTLEISYGWKGKRLKDFIELFIDNNRLMWGIGIIKPFDADDISKTMKQKYNINLDELIKINEGKLTNEQSI